MPPPTQRPVTLRKALPGDEMRLSGLYQEVYHGHYPDPLMTKLSLLAEALRKDEYLWIVAESTNGALVGSVVYRIDAPNLLAKVFGSVVLSEFRGSNLTQRLMTLGVELMQSAGEDVAALDRSIEVIYATTRTVTPVPQMLTAGLGYKKLGLFPNVHKTDEYETHGLTALLLPQAIEKRHTDFELHARISPLFELVRQECSLPSIPLLSEPPTSVPLDKNRRPSFEMVAAPRFVQAQFHQEKSEATSLHHRWFFPFQEPNILLTTPTQDVEVFAFVSETDKHCVIMGIHDKMDIGFETVLDTACHLLRSQAVRYLEFIVRADDANKIEAALACSFIPSAYFPALMRHENKRYDYVIFSRSFEILDFKHIQLDGLNLHFLELYYDYWRSTALTESLEMRR